MMRVRQWNMDTLNYPFDHLKQRIFESEKNRSLISIQFNLFKILVETINSNYIYF